MNFTQRVSKPTEGRRRSSMRERMSLTEKTPSPFKSQTHRSGKEEKEIAREVIGIEDREVTRYKAKLEDRARREEELFTRAPLSSVENKKLKHMRKSRFWGCSDHQKTVTKLYVPVLERAITRLAAGTTNNDANSESNSTQNESTNTSYIKKALLAKSQGGCSLADAICSAIDLTEAIASSTCSETLLEVFSSMGQKEDELNRLSDDPANVEQSNTHEAIPNLSSC
ncbi:hypothetical protein Tco_0857299 [Tanacetum coccineum]|uniref:Uncharacterized protein n=1 Tax=Tanacetum coccineum TaxID=301880 RepID=A0ABQ5B976_9ASTR